MSVKVSLTNTWNLASRVEGIWRWVMHKNGWRDFCESTTEFRYINYAYTKDAPEDCIKYGEELWKTLLDQFSGRVFGDGPIALSKSSMSSVTRRHELWDK